MAASDIVPVPGAEFEQTLAAASPDVLREMIRAFGASAMSSTQPSRGAAIASVIQISG